MADRQGTVNRPAVRNQPFFYTFLAITRHSYRSLSTADFPRRKSALYTVSVQLPGDLAGSRLRFCCFGYQNYNKTQRVEHYEQRY